MARGILYVMDTVVSGLVKIGKTGSSNFNDRMRQLENNGYYNVVGLKRKFAIEVDDYDEKEELLHTIFEKSRVGTSELFSIDIEIVVQLLSSFDGNIVYPKKTTKDEVFDEAVEQVRKEAANKDKPSNFEDSSTSNSTNKDIQLPLHVYMKYKDEEAPNFFDAQGLYLGEGKIRVLAGSRASAIEAPHAVPAALRAREEHLDANFIFKEDVEFPSLSTAASAVRGGASNGWDRWKTADGKKLNDIFSR